MTKFTFSYKKTARVSEAELKKVAKKSSSYVKHLQNVVSDGGYSELEASLNVLDDTALVKQVNDLVKKKASSKLKYIVVVGIGGSNLGTMAVYDALRGTMDSLTTSQPKILFIDTVSTSMMKQVQEVLSTVKNANEVLVNVISKSGGTTETIANFESLYGFLKRRIKGIESRFVLTTDEGSKLWNAAQEKGITTLPVPKLVGGRFSVFSAVGLFPLALAGIEIKKLLSGARAMREECLSTSLIKNIALVSAALAYTNHKKDVHISNTFLFNPELESVGKWYRQLVGESLGKKKDLKGKMVHQGITPIVSIGSTDLHSMAQLYLGGPKDKFTTFVYYSEKGTGASVPSSLFMGGLVKGIAGRPFSELMDAIVRGVKEAYRKNSLPYAEIDLSEVSPHTVGQYLQFKMMEVMYLGKLLGLNTFDQPSVEDYKKVTRKILES